MEEFSNKQQLLTFFCICYIIGATESTHMCLSTQALQPLCEVDTVVPILQMRKQEAKHVFQLVGGNSSVKFP